MRTLWLAMLGSLAGYYVLTIFVERPEANEPNSTLFLAFSAIALSAVLISFLVKSKLLSRAIDQQNPQLVQQAYIIAWALCEVGGLLGVLDYFSTADRHYYVPLMIAAAGQLLHFPRREDVMNAAFQSPLA